MRRTGGVVLLTVLASGAAAWARVPSLTEAGGAKCKVERTRKVAALPGPAPQTLGALGMSDAGGLWVMPDAGGLRVQALKKDGAPRGKAWKDAAAAFVPAAVSPTASGFVVTGEGPCPDLRGRCFFARGYSPNGAPVGSVFSSPTPYGFSQLRPCDPYSDAREVVFLPRRADGSPEQAKWLRATLTKDALSVQGATFPVSEDWREQARGSTCFATLGGGLALLLVRDTGEKSARLGIAAEGRGIADVDGWTSGKPALFRPEPGAVRVFVPGTNAAAVVQSDATFTLQKDPGPGWQLPVFAETGTREGVELLRSSPGAPSFRRTPLSKAAQGMEGPVDFARGRLFALWGEHQVRKKKEATNVFIAPVVCAP